jgi:hypothetical protein
MGTPAFCGTRSRTGAGDADSPDVVLPAIVETSSNEVSGHWLGVLEWRAPALALAALHPMEGLCIRRTRDASRVGGAHGGTGVLMSPRSCNQNRMTATGRLHEARPRGVPGAMAAMRTMMAPGFDSDSLPLASRGTGDAGDSELKDSSESVKESRSPNHTGVRPGSGQGTSAQSQIHRRTAPRQG